MLALGIHLASLPNVLSVLTSQALPQAEAACVHGAVLGLKATKSTACLFKKNPMVDFLFMGQIEHSTSQMQGGFPQLFAWLYGQQTATLWTLASSVSRVTSIKLFQYSWLSFTVSPAVLGCDQISFHRTWLGVT